MSVAPEVPETETDTFASIQENPKDPGVSILEEEEEEKEEVTKDMKEEETEDRQKEEVTENMKEEETEDKEETE